MVKATRGPSRLGRPEARKQTRNGPICQWRWNVCGITILIDHVVVVGDKVSALYPVRYYYLVADVSCASMGKARNFGWHGTVDTVESMRHVFQEFVTYRMIPQMDF